MYTCMFRYLVDRLEMRWLYMYPSEYLQLNAHACIVGGRFDHQTSNLFTIIIIQILPQASKKGKERQDRGR